MNKRNKIIVSIVGITIVLLALLGITYAYYLTRIEGNTNTNSISVTTADLKLEYGDGNGYIQATNIQPGNDIAKKTFTVTNKGNVTIENYGVYFEEVINTFELKDDVIFTITCTSSLGNNCYGIEDKIFPSNNELIVNNSIAINETHEYEIKVTYKETGVDQSIDMNKEISAKIQIYDMANVIDITGSVSNIEEGDTLVLYSEPKNSKIINGKYKFVGVESGSHTLYLLDSSGEEKYRKEFTLKKGTENKIDGDTITISEETQK